MFQILNNIPVTKDYCSRRPINILIENLEKEKNP